MKDAFNRGIPPGNPINKPKYMRIPTGKSWFNTRTHLNTRGDAN